MSEEEILKGLKASLSQGSLGPLKQGQQGLPERRYDPEPSPSLLGGAPGALSLAGPDPLRLRVHLDTVETPVLLVSGAWKFTAGFLATQSLGLTVDARVLSRPRDDGPAHSLDFCPSFLFCPWFPPGTGCQF